MTRWEDVDARARGLGTHLPTVAELQLLSRAPDIPALEDRKSVV